ncbi:CPBP family intramembrane glutamic endopeptidase [Halorussus sp. MSC15.2]|uniref:CPBP family intramembrane glutamic endopeptidase n=1 Tax=Halorussus sp. MSC15.2 TaxID=2283638 RepID=UPI0013CFDC48|nr:type II CAAX endopeptidase family protein [Halorussus sp. MSC15.2]NEU55621.1 CPBP family intramembrane metalloprotease [Halorussus sp. MSC15.2]
MEDRSAASVGVVLAGFTLAAAALPWGTVGIGPVENVILAVLGVTAFGAFVLRRHDVLARGPGSLVAGVASLGVVGYVGVSRASAFAGRSTLAEGTTLSVDVTAVSPWGVTLALIGGVGGVIAAYGDGRGLPESLGTAVKAAGWGLAVGFAGLFAIAAWASVLVSIVAGLVPGDPGTATQLAISAVALGLGTGTVALIYFQWTDKTLAFLDFRVPTLRDLGYVGGGILALFGLQVLVTVVFSQLGLSTAEHNVQQAAAGGNAEILLLLIPASWLIIGPGEELLYRNIIQKSLYPTFGEWGGVLVASVVFSLAHIPAYAAGADLPALLSTLAVIFFLSLILGATYLKTDNVTVSALIHGTFDAIIFAAMYVQMTGGA